MMGYRFVIQASAPRAIVRLDPADESLSDAIQTVFCLATEDAIMNWNGVYVPIGYKYDMSMMIDDVLDLLEEMRLVGAGTRVIQWASNTFSATWDVEWDADMVTVLAGWIDVIGGTESLLGANCKLCVSKTEFGAEWKRPLEVVLRALEAAGYNDADLEGMNRLRSVSGNIVGEGLLYRP
jgi:hypothetical protein